MAGTGTGIDWDRALPALAGVGPMVDLIQRGTLSPPYAPFGLPNMPEIPVTGSTRAADELAEKMAEQRRKMAERRFA